jgi:hypothetical protein
MSLRAGLRQIRKVWAREWLEAHLTMDKKRWQIRLSFFLIIAPLLILLTPVVFIQGAWR